MVTTEVWLRPALNRSTGVGMPGTDTALSALVIAISDLRYANGQFKLQVYAEGFAPMVQAFDEFTPDVEVRLARAAECL